VIRRVLITVFTLTALAATAASAQAFTEPPVRGVPYGPLPEEIVTIYTAPTTSAPAPTSAPATSRAAFATAAASTGLPPAVVLVHGGGWRQQPNETEQPTAAQGLRDHGFVVFDVNYPQAGFYTTAFPKEPEAIAAAVGWVHEHAAEFGADPENIVLLGGSAGGHLVNVVGEERLPGVRAVISLSGPTNLVSLLSLAQHQETTSSLAISIAMALGCGRNTVGWAKVLFCGPANVALAEQFSPVQHVGTAPCPNWLLFSAEEDLVPLSQQQEFLPALQAGGCSGSLSVVPGKGHAFGYWYYAGPQIYSFIAAN
jgi:acetyl esterase/lipase